VLEDAVVDEEVEEDVDEDVVVVVEDDVDVE